VHCAPIIPHSNRANGPLPPHRVVVCRMDMVVEEIKQLVRFGFLQFRKTGDEAIVHIKGFEASDRVSADSWVMSVDRSAVRRNSPEVKDCVIWKTWC
jgi:hypothetical protein